MAYVIAYNLRKHYNKSSQEGQKYYRKYFINTQIYLPYKEEVDAYLIAWGIAGCIVTE